MTQEIRVPLGNGGVLVLGTSQIIVPLLGTQVITFKAPKNQIARLEINRVQDLALMASGVLLLDYAYHLVRIYAAYILGGALMAIGAALIYLCLRSYVALEISYDSGTRLSLPLYRWKRKRAGMEMLHAAVINTVMANYLNGEMHGANSGQSQERGKDR